MQKTLATIGTPAFLTYGCHSRLTNYRSFPQPSPDNSVDQGKPGESPGRKVMGPYSGSPDRRKENGT